MGFRGKWQPDDVIVETQFTLLPGGRVNWQGQVRLLVPPDFYFGRTGPILK